ncbi:hypothetical protein ACQ4PT_024360 [Festuca glaucescens]
MASFRAIIFPLLLLAVLVLARAKEDPPTYRTYFIFVSPPADAEAMSRSSYRGWHETFLPKTLTASGEKRMVCSYTAVFHGFAARLTEAELAAVAKLPGFVRALPDGRCELQTTRTPQFLGLNTDGGQTWSDTGFGRGVVIGIVDTGIYGKHSSFSDEGVPEPPARWKGNCTGSDATRCNRKLVGAKSFTGDADPQDDESGGHGTHVASIAAGNFVEGASLDDELGFGTAAGIAPHAHVAMYKVCKRGGGCSYSSLTCGMEEAVHDGVDVINLSIGSSLKKAFDQDPIGYSHRRIQRDGQGGPCGRVGRQLWPHAIHSVQRCPLDAQRRRRLSRPPLRGPGGEKQKPNELSCVKAQRWSPPPDDILKINTDGSFRETSHTGGWGFTIRNADGNLIAAGAGNLERVSDALHAEAQAMLHATIIASHMGCQNVVFETDSAQLKHAVTTEDYNLSPLAAMFREIKFHLSVGFNDNTGLEGDYGVVDGNYCDNDRQLGDIAHKMIICRSVTDGSQRSIIRRVRDLGAGGVILIDDVRHGYTTMLTKFDGFNVIMVNNFVGRGLIKNYGNSTARVSFNGAMINITNSPAVAYFSSRGPGQLSRGLLKPDVLTPGLNIMAASSKPTTDGLSRNFRVKSGTSMAAPHITGVVALLKTAYPDWSPAALKSAIMTTSANGDSTGGPILDEQHNNAAYFTMGAGHVNPSNAMDPGLVYNISAKDYAAYICGQQGEDALCHA